MVTKRKKKDSAAQGVLPAASVVVEAAAPCLDAHELKSFLYLTERLKNIELSRRISALDWEEAARKHSVKLQKMEAEEKETRVEYTVLVASVGQRLSIDMKSYAYDDKTGTLSLVKG
jgi:hypothetical protein